MKRVNFITLLFAILIAFLPNQALAEIGGLTKCSESPAFEKRLKASVKKLEQRISKYEADSPPVLALQQQIERTKARFDKYSRSELLCGTDGLPHLIADGRWSHAAEFILPGFGFIYISGWIGWVGRKYLRAVSTTKNPSESESTPDEKPPTSFIVRLLVPSTCCGMIIGRGGTNIKSLKEKSEVTYIQLSPKEHEVMIGGSTL